MQNDRKFIIRVRALISHEDKILVVKHGEEYDYYALPGGKLEFGENPLECLHREMVEEMGIEPETGKLLYVNSFMQEDGHQTVEFIFEVINAKDYLNIKNLNGTHKHELFDILWAGKDADIKIYPKRIQTDFKSGSFPEVVMFVS